jgi:hypothetical protein
VVVIREEVAVGLLATNGGGDSLATALSARCRTRMISKLVFGARPCARDQISRKILM